MGLCTAPVHSKLSKRAILSDGHILEHGYIGFNLFKSIYASHGVPFSVISLILRRASVVFNVHGTMVQFSGLYGPLSLSLAMQYLPLPLND